ncbi:MAG: hypothetical protein WD604_05835 [Balneolaceae bacterium]
MKKYYKYLLTILLPGFIGLTQFESSFAQIQEPEVEQVVREAPTLREGYSSGLGLNILMNNFGFGVGGEFRKVISSQTEAFLTLRITGLRDVSEQTFTDVFFGQQVIPNKYQRAFAFPALIGFRQRFFADRIQEDYRFFASVAAGPVLTFSFPYFEDANNNGYREQGYETPQGYFEPVNDIFTGWNNGNWKWGGTGEFKIGVDIGRNFSNLSSVEFGYYIYYFPDGMQLMMPNQPMVNEEGEFMLRPDGHLEVEPFFDSQQFFGTPQITFSFGKLW